MNLNNMQPVLVQSPHDGKYYNIAELFRFMEEYGETFCTLAEQIENASEMVPYLLEHDDFSPLEVKNATNTCNMLKRVFRKLKPIEN